MQNTVISYEKAIQTLTSQGKFYINLGLERVQALLELYDNPQNKIKYIHVAGTNGKGSTCAMLASVLKEAGYKTGLYTSPHLVDYTERIKINSKDIPREDFAEIVLDVIQTAESNGGLSKNTSKNEKNRELIKGGDCRHATEFEILTVAAFVYFEREKVDCGILETGLGGRLDATNVVKKPLASIITSIDLDHVDRLGDTIEKIAFEKAGIIKQNVPVVTLKENNGLKIIEQKALESDSEILFAEYEDNYETNLSGLWQKKNLPLVLKAVDILRRKGFSIPEKALKEGLKKISWTGRFQYIEELNLILDGAHNPASARLLRKSLEFYYPRQERIWIYSSINTKNYKEVMEILFRDEDTVIFTKSNSGAAVEPDVLKENMKKACKIFLAEDIKQSVDTYLSIGMDNKIGIMTGSLYTLGDFLAGSYMPNK